MAEEDWVRRHVLTVPKRKQRGDDQVSAVHLEAAGKASAAQIEGLARSVAGEGVFFPARGVVAPWGVQLGSHAGKGLRWHGGPKWLMTRPSFCCANSAALLVENFQTPTPRGIAWNSN